MSLVVIDYDQLGSVARNADNAANRMNNYINALTKKVSNKYSSLEGGQSSKTSNSQYYVNQKIRSLDSKKTAYTSFASDIRKLSTRAKEVDKEVAKTINASKDEFITKHDYVDTNWWTDLKGWFIDMKNKCPLFDAICTLVQNITDNISNSLRDLKYWYKCGGGKEILDIGFAVLGFAATLVIAIASFPVSGLVAFCAAVGACLTAMNALVNVFTSVRARQAKANGDPAWAKIYSEQDTAQDLFRQTNFKNGLLNKLSYFAAASIDTVQLVCDVVAVYDGIKHVQNTYRELKKYANQSRTRNFGQIFKDYLFNKKNYAGKKMRDDVIRPREKIRTLRNYKKTKAMSAKQYDDSLTSWGKLSKKLKKCGKIVNTSNDIAQQVIGFLSGDKISLLKPIKYATEDFPTSKTLFKIYDLYDKDWSKGFKYDIKGFKAMAGKAD